ncbi:unnamed protein product [Protopolystoma xenopodis]|uniref:Uncharacterized protein n=1 Tax=Protopolystoma xenopodis TaxID=117903 RepID=A0A3S5FDU0_9PLAT|nr:unnamed protein product [Protopolystoma xenopodis]
MIAFNWLSQILQAGILGQRETFSQLQSTARDLRIQPAVTKAAKNIGETQRLLTEVKTGWERLRTTTKERQAGLESALNEVSGFIKMES